MLVLKHRTFHVNLVYRSICRKEHVVNADIHRVYDIDSATYFDD